jgi:hypothetical protein
MHRGVRSPSRTGPQWVTLGGSPWATVDTPLGPEVETGVPSDEDGALEIVLGHGRRVWVRGRVDVHWLGQVVATLDAPRC